jgi:hypothetical protein
MSSIGGIPSIRAQSPVELGVYDGVDSKISYVPMPVMMPVQEPENSKTKVEFKSTFIDPLYRQSSIEKSSRINSQYDPFKTYESSLGGQPMYGSVILVSANPKKTVQVYTCAICGYEIWEG